MDVQLPNGQLLRGVPDGTTKAQLAEKLSANGFQVPPEWSTPSKPRTEAAEMPSWSPVAKGIEDTVSSIPGGGLAQRAAEGVWNLGGKIVSGLAGAGSLALGRGADASAQTVQNVQDALHAGPSESANRDPLVQGLGKINEAGNKLFAPVDRAVARSGNVGETVIPAVENAISDIATILPVAQAGKLLRNAPRSAIEQEVLQRGNVPSREQLRAAADAQYKAADDAGAVLTPTNVDQLKASVESLRGNPTLHPRANAVIDEINALDGPTSLKQLEDTRRMAGEAQKGNPAKADVRRLNLVQDAIDRHMDSLTAADTVAGDAPAAVQALTDARNLYSRSAKDSTISQLIEKAKIRAESSPALSDYQAITTQFRTLAVNQKRMKLFTPEEQVAIRDMAKGSGAQRSLFALSRLSKGLTAHTAATAAGWVLGKAPGAVAGAIGADVASVGARTLAEKLQAGRAEDLGALMRRGPANSAPLSRPPVEEPTVRPTPMKLLPAPAAPEPMVSGGARGRAAGKFQSASPAPTATETQLGEVGLTPDVRDAQGKHPGYSRPQAASEAAPIAHSVTETGQHEVQWRGVGNGGHALAQENGDHLQIKLSKVDKPGQGVGTDLYERLAKEATKEGKTLSSDISVSPSAAATWSALKRRGYKVRTNPYHINKDTGNLVSEDPRVPVFEIIDEP